MEQEWKGMDGAIAFHLIDRHAENWAHSGKMMREWREANESDELEQLRQRVAELKAERDAALVESRDACIGLNDFFGKEITTLKSALREAKDALQSKHTVGCRAWQAERGKAIATIVTAIGEEK